MNLAKLADAALRRAPTTARGTITFTNTAGSSTTGLAVGVPATGSPADGFKVQQMIRDKTRTLSVSAEGLDFAPQAGMTATWAGMTWSVQAVSPLQPDGATAALYRVTIQR